MSLRDAAYEFSDIAPSFFTSDQLDITEVEQIRKRFEEVQPDYCINCAAYTQVDQAEAEPEAAMAVNAHGVKNLAAVCAETSTVLIHISTDYVFDGTSESGYTPDHLPNPINVYGASKWQGEKMVAERIRTYFIVRTSWLYSRKYGPNFYTKILAQAREGKDLRVTDAQRGRPTDAGNLARFLFTLVRDEREDYGIHHFTDGQSMTWYEFAEKILEENHMRDATVLVKDNKSRSFAHRPRNSILL